MRTIKITLVLILSILMIAVTACSLNEVGQPSTRGNVNDGPLTRGNVNDNNVSPYNYNGDYYSDRLSMGTDGLQAEEFDRTTNTNEEAKKLAATAAKINGVDDATVVIFGGNVYVALDLDDQVQSSQASKVEREVYSKLAKMSTSNRIMITTDADLYGRLRDVGDGLRTGTPVNVYDNDFRLFDRNFRFNVR